MKLRFRFIGFALLVVVSLIETPAVLNASDSRTAIRESSQGADLKQAGEALFRYWGFRVYEARLFFPERTAEKNPILIRPKMLTLTYFRNFTAEDFIRSSREIIAKNPNIQIERVASCLAELGALFQPVESGDRYEIVHLDSGQLALWLNSDRLGVVCDEYSTRAYFSIWLSKEWSIGDSFQEELLGKQSIHSIFSSKGIEK